EGPIGRLIPGSVKNDTPAKPGPAEPIVTKVEEKENGAPPPPPAPTMSPPKPSLVEQAKETWEDWQTKIDERVKAVVPNLLPWQQLQLEIKRLNARIEELEEKL